MRSEPAERIAPFHTPGAPHEPAAPEACPTKRSAAAVALAWLLSFVLLGGLLLGGLYWRNEVMRAWPPSERLYQALGITRQ